MTIKDLSVVVENSPLIDEAQRLQKEIVSKGNLFLETAKTTIIENDKDYEDAANLVKENRAETNKIKKLIKPIKDAANDVANSIRSVEKACVSPREKGGKLILQRMDEYEAERKRKAEAIQKEIEEKQRKEAEEGALEKAGGDKELAEKILEGDLMPEPPAVVAAPLPKVTGLGRRVTVHARVVDFKKLILAAAEEINSGVEKPQLLNYLRAEMTLLNSLASVQKEAFNIPGVVAENSKGEVLSS